MASLLTVTEGPESVDANSATARAARARSSSLPPLMTSIFACGLLGWGWMETVEVAVPLMPSKVLPPGRMTTALPSGKLFSSTGNCAPRVPA